MDVFETYLLGKIVEFELNKKDNFNGVLRPFYTVKLHGREALSIFDKLAGKSTRKFPCTLASCASQRYMGISMYLRHLCFSKVHGNFHVPSPFVLLKGTWEFPCFYASCATQKYTEIPMYFNAAAR